MSNATCKTCPWCQELLASIDGLDGECHKNAPTVDGETAHNMRMPVGSALWPLVSMGRDWCGSHPDRQPHLECATTTLLSGETVPTAADMRRIVDALEKMATCAAGGVVTAREALTQLLAENPGGIVTVAMVCARMGRVVSRNAVSKQAGNLGRSMCVGIPGQLGGYRSRVAS